MRAMWQGDTVVVMMSIPTAYKLHRGIHRYLQNDFDNYEDLDQALEGLKNLLFYTEQKWREANFGSNEEDS